MCGTLLLTVLNAYLHRNNIRKIHTVRILKFDFRTVFLANKVEKTCKCVYVWKFSHFIITNILHVSYIYAQSLTCANFERKSTQASGNQFIMDCTNKRHHKQSHDSHASSGRQLLIEKLDIRSSIACGHWIASNTFLFLFNCFDFRWFFFFSFSYFTLLIKGNDWFRMKEKTFNILNEKEFLKQSKYWIVVTSIGFFRR